MKIARFFGVILGICGGVLMAAAVALCLMNLDAPVSMGEVPQDAVACVQAFGEALAAGDFSAASTHIYGQPELGAGREPASPEGKAVWALYKKSISWELLGALQVTDRGLAVPARITVLDIPSVTGKVAGYAGALLNAKVANATTMEELYDANNNFRADLLDEVIQQALEQALAEGGIRNTWETTVEVIFRDGAWWLLPDAAFFDALRGGVA